MPNPVKNKYIRRSYKIEYNKILVDILVEHKKDTPKDLLLYENERIYYKIQSVENVFEARSSYNCGKGTIRAKDHISTIKMKELNFNI